MLPNTNGFIKIWQGYRKISDETDFLQFPFPRTDKIIDGFGSCKYFTKLHLKI